MLFIIKKICIIVIEQCMKLLWLFPLKKDTMMFYSYDGKTINDNPLYLSAEISRRYPAVRRVFVSKDENSTKLLKESDKLVKPGLMSFYYCLATSKVIVFNSALPSFLPIRRTQIVLNTWHGGSPLKTCGLSSNMSTEYDFFHLNRQAEKVTAYLSSSRFMTEQVIRGSLAFKGEIVESGMPRNALLCSHTFEKKREMRHFLGLSENDYIVLYAPTFRGNHKNGGFIKEDLQLTPTEIKAAFARMIPDREIIVLFRSHHAMCEAVDFSTGFVNVTCHSDMQELLLASDALITDYSSCMGDICLCRAPVFLYTPDLEEYTRDKGFYWDIHELPFPVCKTKQEFTEAIKAFSLFDYEKDIESYLAKIESFEGPDSASIAADWLLAKLDAKPIRER